MDVEVLCFLLFSPVVFSFLTVLKNMFASATDKISCDN
jgi:hypothetical protein